MIIFDRVFLLSNFAKMSLLWVPFLLVDLCLIAVYGTLLLWRYWRPLPAVSFVPSGNELVVLLHGSGADDRQFILAKKILGELPVASLNIPHVHHTTVNDCVIHLHSFLQTQGARRVVLVGMSMGGLVAAATAYQKLEAGRIVGLVTIGTPWKGAPLLRYAPGWFSLPQRHVEMTPGSKVLGELCDAACMRSDIPLLTIGSRSDIHVPEPYSHPCEQDLEHMEHVALSFPGHIALTVDPRVWRRVREFIQQLLN